MTTRTSRKSIVTRLSSKTGPIFVKTESNHPVFLYLNPAAEKLEEFSFIIKKFADTALIEKTNKQLLYQYGHVQVAFETFVSQAQLYFNVTWSDKNKSRTVLSGALYKSGNDLLEKWAKLVELTNNSFTEGYEPLFKLLFDKLNVILGSFNSLYREIKACSIESSFLIKTKRNLTNKILNFKKEVLHHTLKSKSPDYQFDMEKFTKEFNEIMASLLKFISMIPYSLSMKNGLLMRDKTSMQYIISETKKIGASIENFKPAEASFKESLFNINEVLTDLMVKLGFPFEFHIKFSNLIPKDEKEKKEEKEAEEAKDEKA